MAVNLCDLGNWTTWTSLALPPGMQWHLERPNALYEFRIKVLATNWPQEFEELGRATKTLSILLHNLALEFRKHCALSGDYLVADCFYKNIPNNPNYYEDLRTFERWQDSCFELIFDCTKAVNWFSDMVRRDIDPMFFAKKGKFYIEWGPNESLSFQAAIPEFTEEEKKDLPGILKDS